MTEQTEQVTTQTGAVPARIELEDFIEAVARGVARALAAQDEVSGYVQTPPGTLQAYDFKGLTVLAGFVGRDPITERPH